VWRRWLDFSRRLRLHPIVLRKEHRGYVCNAMLVRLLAAALELAVEEVARIEDIDQAWMTVMQTPQGPFALMDSVGLDTVANILRFGTLVEAHNPLYPRALAWLQPLLEAGHLGQKTGRVFTTTTQTAARRRERRPGPEGQSKPRPLTRRGALGGLAPGLRTCRPRRARGNDCRSCICHWPGGGRQRHAVDGQGIGLGAVFRQDIVIGLTQGELFDLPISAQGEDMAIGIGDGGVEGAAGHRRQVINIAGPDLQAGFDLIVAAEPESPGIPPASFPG
jgi:hypothetical protein